MTNREFFMAIVNGTLITKEKNINGDIVENERSIFDENGFDLTDEVKEFAKASIAKLDKKNENRKNSTSPNQVKNEDFKSNIYDDMIAEPNRVFTAKEIADKYGVSTQKISALLRQIVDTGAIKSFDTKDSKKNKVKGYQIVQ
jgi:Fic family protein